MFFVLFTHKIYEHLFESEKKLKKLKEKERLYIWKTIRTTVNVHSYGFLEKTNQPSSLECERLV